MRWIKRAKLWRTNESGQTDPGLTAVSYVRRLLAVDDPWASPLPRGFSWWGGPFRQQVWADPVEEHEGLLTSRVHVRTDLLRGCSIERGAIESLHSVALQASLYSICRSEEGSGLQMASSVALHDQSLEYGQRILASAAAMQIGECATIAVLLQEALSGAELAMTPHPKKGFREDLDEMMGIVDTLVLNKGREESVCKAADLAVAADLARQHEGVSVRIDGNEIRARFVCGDGNAVVFANREVRHPKLGGGVLIGLQGIRKISSPSIGLLLSLNEAECRAQVPVHCIGSWLCKDGMLAHACFIPNAMYDRNVFVNLFLSNFIRVLWAHEVVDDL